MTRVRSFDARLPPESHDCLRRLPEIIELSAFINPIPGGRSKAQIWQVRFRQRGQDQDTIGILKLGYSETISREIQNHKNASRSTDCPPMPILLATGLPIANWRALIFSVAKGLLYRSHSLGDLIREARALKIVNGLCTSLAKWYSHCSHQTCEGFSFIRLLHQRHLDPKHNPFKQIAVKFGIDINAGQVLFEGENNSRSLPNPFHVLMHKDAIDDQKQFSAPFGSVHGDLHLGNIVVSGDVLDSPVLIDLAHYNDKGSILHDLAFLEISIALKSVDFSLDEGKRQWEMFFQNGWFTPQPEQLPAELIGLWEQIRSIRQIVLDLAQGDEGIQDEYRVAYLHAIVSAALRWVRFEDDPIEKHMGAFYVAARALENLRNRGFVRLHKGISKLTWRPLITSVSADAERCMEEGRQWFRIYGRRTLEEGPCILVIGPDLVKTIMEYQESDLAAVAGLKLAKKGSSENDPVWAEKLEHDETDEQKRQLVGKYLRKAAANSELVRLLGLIPWSAVFDWNQAPDLFEQFRQISEGQRRVYRLFLGEKSTTQDRLDPIRTLWIALRGAPDPLDLMVWGEEWIDKLPIWRRQLAAWSSQLTNPPLIVGIGLNQPMKEDIWSTVYEIFGAESKFVNISHPTSNGRPSQRTILRHMTQLDLTPEQWFDLMREFFPVHPRILAGDVTDRTVVFNLPESRKIKPGAEELKTIILEPDEMVRLSEYFEVLTEFTGQEALPEGRAPGDLFRGYPVLWQEIRQGFAITREREKEMLEAIHADLDIGNPRRLHLHHEPGAGGSVLARQIAYKLYKNRHIPVLILCKFLADEVIERLRAFWYQVDRSFLVIVEDEFCSLEEWETVYTALQQSQIPVVALLINTCSPEWIRLQSDAQKDVPETFEHRRFFLLDQLTDKELDELHNHLEVFLRSGVVNSLSNFPSHSLFGTIFSVFEGDFTRHRHIISELVNDAKPVLANLLRTLAFFRLYGDTPWVPQELMLRLANVSIDMEPSTILSDFRDRLVLQQGGGASSVWAISHTVLAEDLLAELLGENENVS